MTQTEVTKICGQVSTCHIKMNIHLQDDSACCIDLGLTASKSAVGVVKDKVKTVYTVPHRRVVRNANRNTAWEAAGSQRDFIALAALQNGVLVHGRRCLSMDRSVPCKTIITHLAQISAFAKLPGGRELQRMIDSKVVTHAMEEEVCKEHLADLVDAAVERADDVGIFIEKVVLTYPNYMTPSGKGFWRYKACYFRLIRPLLAKVNPNVQVEWVSEGQATALYICDLYTDPSGSFHRRRLWEAFEDLLQRSRMIRLLVIDGGSSTFNIQHQFVWLDNDGQVVQSQSVYGPGWRGGAISGSHLSNAWVANLLRGIASIKAQDRVELLNDFEAKKYTYDYTSKKRLLLKGRGEGVDVWLDPEHLGAAYREAFHPGLEVLKSEFNRVLEREEDFGVVFAGGSFLDAGLRTEVTAYVREVQEDAKSRGIIVRAVFPADWDLTWSSAVSIGGVTSVLNVPSPTEVLDCAAIGLQLMWQGNNLDEAETIARPLFSKGQSPVPWVFDFSGKETKDLRISLVCNSKYREPNTLNNGHHTQTARRHRKRLEPPRKRRHASPSDWARPIQINDLFTYDMSFSVKARELPPGAVCFELQGEHIALLAGVPAQQALLAHQTRIVADLCCTRFDLNTGKRMRHSSNKRWRLVLVTDPATKLVVVDTDTEMSPPILCAECQKDLVSEGFQCSTCQGYHICVECAGITEHQHEMDSFSVGA
ncbi:hypothetical protein F5Y18DRAFT_435888 [Xylariaceae sp. FL1019]|nr:hypothetical protein F5Y18DRAFT_435888 [Xylariaceae sp. FL1019]